MISTNISGATLISNDAIAGECRTFEAKLRFGEVDYDGLISFTYTSYISPQKCTFGCTPSAIFQCEAVNLASSALSLKNQVFKAMISIAGLNDYICLGEFKITEATLKDGIYNITAYDKMNFVKDKPYLPTISGQQLVFNVFKDICTQIDNEGITSGFTKINPVTFTDTAKIDPSILSGYPLKDALSYLCAYAGRNCIVNRNGAFEARKFTLHSAYTLLNDDRIETPELDEFDSEIQSLTTLTSDENMLSAGTSSAQGITVLCPVMTQSKLNDLYNNDFGLASSAVHLFRAGKVNQILGDPRLEVGDVITLTHEGKAYNFPIMSLKMQFDGGLMTEIEAFGFGDDEGVSLAQKIDFALKKSKDISKYAQASSDLSGVIAGGLGLYKTELSDASGAIRTYMHDKPTLEASSYITTFNSNGFAWTVNGWNNGNPTWLNGINTADSSMVMRAISAHRITADLIDVTDLSALSATIGGWKILSTRLENDCIVLNDDGTYSGYRSGMQCKNNTPSSAAFYAGCTSKTSIATAASSKFFVTQGGKLFASEAEISGKITAKSGTIANFEIADKDTSPSNGFWANSLSCVNKNPNNNSNDYYAVFIRNGGAYNTAAFGVKKCTKTSKPVSADWGDAEYLFYVSNNGLLMAKNANITGSITATSLTLGENVTISYTKLSDKPDLTIYQTKTGAITRGTYQSGSTGIRISSAGLLQASNAVIYGTLYASAGKIGGWTIDNNGISSTSSSNYTVYICNYNNTNDGSRIFHCHNNTANKDTFSVTRAGKLFASNADIEGKITATSGKIGGFDINDFYLCTNGKTWGYDGALLLCSTGSTGKRNIAGSGSVDGWTITSGANFGVRSDGTMYANAALLQGAIITGAVLSSITITDNLETYGTVRFFYNNQFQEGINSGTVTTAGGTKVTGFHVGIAAVPLYLWGNSVKLSSGATVTSDERLKNSITDFNSAHEALFENLQPKTFKYNNGTSDRTHFGFIAQQLKDAIDKSGLTTHEVAAYVSEECEAGGKADYILSIRYSELVALNTHMIQKCMKKISVLEAEILTLKSERN